MEIRLTRLPLSDTNLLHVARAIGQNNIPLELGRGTDASASRPDRSCAIIFSWTALQVLACTENLAQIYEIQFNVIN